MTAWARMKKMVAGEIQKREDRRYEAVVRTLEERPIHRSGDIPLDDTVVEVSWVVNRLVEMHDFEDGTATMMRNKVRACRLKVDLGLSSWYLSESGKSLN